jgi:hypothetical protein
MSAVGRVETVRLPAAVASRVIHRIAVWAAVMLLLLLANAARAVEQIVQVALPAGASGGASIVDDACFLWSSAAAKRFAESGGYPSIAVYGGDVKNGPCEALSHHGFYRKDHAVVAAIKAWISGGEWPKEIE